MKIPRRPISEKAQQKGETEMAQQRPEKAQQMPIPISTTGLPTATSTSVSPQLALKTTSRKAATKFMVEKLKTHHKPPSAINQQHMLTTQAMAQPKHRPIPSPGRMTGEKYNNIINHQPLVLLTQLTETEL